jgi:hypothetical protein
MVVADRSDTSIPLSILLIGVVVIVAIGEPPEFVAG